MLCQTSAQSFGGFATMTGGVFQLVIQLFVGDVDSFLGSDAIDDQFRFHIVGRAFLLAAAQRDPIDVYGPRVDSLGGQGAHHAFEPHIHLMFDERFGYRKIVELDDGRQNLLAQQILVLLIARSFEALPQLGF